MPEHDHYAELCALAATAQLSEGEFKELSAHIENCGVCRDALGDYRQLVCHALPQSRPSISVLRDLATTHPREGARQRFLRRARSEGIRIPDEADGQEPSAFRIFNLPRFAPHFAAAVLLIAFGITAYKSLPNKNISPTPTHSVSSEVLNNLQQENAKLRAELEQAKQFADSRTRELARLQDAQSSLAQQVIGLQQLIQETQRKADSFARSLAAANAKNVDMDSRLLADTKALADMRAELQTLRSAKTESEAALIAQQTKIADLSEKVRLQAANLDMDRQLLAANRDIRDLMGARDLHITDVHDSDGRGKQTKVFGRIFYTQGKSLIFYAFDLGDKRLQNAKYSFQAWGQQEGKAHSAKSLGLMYLDDKAQKRWVLKVSDPNLLTQIDSVFVTVEPAGGGKKPTGQKLLYAYLSNQPNHP